ELLSRCGAIVSRQAHSRSCSILVDDTADLRYLRAGEHFLVFLDRAEEVIIIDILHSRSDLPRHIAALTTLRSNES
ncbi:type II toxin-antitoxin system RelE/ParE family toxin, partial [Mesobacterium sp. TK19101]